VKTLQHWQTDPDLAGLGDPEPLAKLAEPEQETCRKLWADVEALLKKVQEAKKKLLFRKRAPLNETGVSGDVPKQEFGNEPEEEFGNQPNKVRPLTSIGILTSRSSSKLRPIKIPLASRECLGNPSVNVKLVCSFATWSVRY
jgi:hypothetical protein